MSDPNPPKRPKLSNNETNSPQIHSLHRPISPPPKSKSKSNPIPSPIQLTHIRDLPLTSNTDTIQLKDLLHDPLIRECWQFNYLFDVDFLMSQFDPDVRGLVDIKVVHGSWRREDGNRVRIEEACTRYPNVEAVVAYMPEAFGTHHCKMMVLFGHDGFARVIIHTANMIPLDWTNMSQAVWRSPPLPLLETSADANTNAQDSSDAAIGTGARFKRDLLAYLNEYGRRKTGSLIDQLQKYDFSAVRAALVASVPSKKKLGGDVQGPRWGWPGLMDVVGGIPMERGGVPHVVCQMSSVATLGQTDKWLKGVFFKALCSDNVAAKYSIVFPTADEIRRSINGYASGGSIHMKIQSAAQQKQLTYMRPYLRHWAGDGDGHEAQKREAGRRRAAPHIKTYMRFSDETMQDIDWAMVTSANLSTQAWGAAANANDEVRICSWEIGVVVWPQLFAEGGQSMTMVPCFKQDTPDTTEPETRTVGLRMPYDLPLTPYRKKEEPWCATATHSEPDWLGQTWDA